MKMTAQLFFIFVAMSIAAISLPSAVIAGTNPTCTSAENYDCSVSAGDTNSSTYLFGGFQTTYNTTLSIVQFVIGNQAAGANPVLFICPADGSGFKPDPSTYIYSTNVSPSFHGSYTVGSNTAPIVANTWYFIGVQDLSMNYSSSLTNCNTDGITLSAWLGTGASLTTATYTSTSMPPIFKIGLTDCPPSSSPSTQSVTPSFSPSTSLTPSGSDSPSTSVTPSESSSNSFSLSASVSVSESPSNSPMPSPSTSSTLNPSPSSSGSTSLSASLSPSASVSPSDSVTPSNEPSASISPSASDLPSASPSNSIMPSISPSSSEAPSSTPAPLTISGNSAAGQVDFGVYSDSFGFTSTTQKSGSPIEIEFVCTELIELSSSVVARSTALDTGFTAAQTGAKSIELSKETDYGEILLEFTVKDADDPVRFANSGFTVLAGHVKFQLSLANWQPLTDATVVELKCNLQTLEKSFDQAYLNLHKKGNLYSLDIGNKDYSANVLFARSCILDGRFINTVITLDAPSPNVGGLTVFFPPFSDTLQFDPAIGLLPQGVINEGTGGDGGDGDGDGQTIGLVVGLVIGVPLVCCCIILCIVVIVVIVMVVYKKRDDLSMPSISRAKFRRGRVEVFDDY